MSLVRVMTPGLANSECARALILVIAAKANKNNVEALNRHDSDRIDGERVSTKDGITAAA